MKRSTIILFLIFSCYAVNAQISTEETPYSWNSEKERVTRESIPMKSLPHLNMEVINQEDSKNEDFGGAPARFGISDDVNFDLSNSGIWQTTADGGRLWNLKIFSPDALSLNLLYDKFWLPDGAKFFIYSEDKTQYLGAFTSENNQGDRDSIMGFATGFLHTNSIVLEYYEPKEVEAKGVISIAQIVSGYRYVYDIVEKGKQLRHNYTDLTCHIDVNCMTDLGYDREKNAVAYMVMGGYICTGALLNTTANDHRPVFLSANHCFTSTPTSQWVFYWNYEAPCGSIVNESSSKSTIGATMLSKRPETDFMLLNLIENPANNPNITTHYLGWDRSTASTTFGVGIHHPNGAQKKISVTTKAIINHPNKINWVGGDTTPANTHWKVDFTDGTVEGGSSGSPILNRYRRVIGQLHGGNNYCPPNSIKYYGRFDLSWNGGGSITTRLKDWLDPLNTNVSYLDGTGCHTILSNRTISVDTNISCNNVSIQGLNVGNSTKLTFKAEVSFSGTFEIEQGSELEIDTPYRIY